MHRYIKGGGTILTASDVVATTVACLILIVQQWCGEVLLGADKASFVRLRRLATYNVTRISTKQAGDFC
jgi:hypothetical protein